MSNPFFAGSTAESAKKSAQKREQDAQKSVWLDAWFEPLLHLDAQERTVVTTDLFGDNDYKLLVTTYDDRPRVKVFKNTSVVCELQLPGRTSSLVTFYQDKKTLKDTKTNAPILAVACDDSVYFYRHLKPVSKLTLPQVSVPSQDKALWEQLQGCTDVTADLATSLYTMLADAREEGFDLSARSRTFLDITSKKVAELFPQLDAAAVSAKVVEIRCMYIQRALTLPHAETTAISVMATLPISTDEKAGSLLVVGTEHGEIHIMNGLFNTVMFTIQLPATPFKILVQGTVIYDVKMYIACRDGTIYCLSYPGPLPLPSTAYMEDPKYDARKHPMTLGIAVAVGHPLVDFLVFDSQVVVATMHKELIYYNHVYQPKHTIKLPAVPTHLRLLSVEKVINVKCVLAALDNSEILMYNNAALIDTIRFHSPLLSLTLGCYAKEDSAMLAICKDGSLYVKILQRNLDMERFRVGQQGVAAAAAASMPVEVPNTPKAKAAAAAALAASLAADGTIIPTWQQDLPLRLPEKSHLFVQQAHYEREHNEEIHQLYQRDLCKLRLLTTRTYYEMQHSAGAGQSVSAKGHMRMSVSVTGLMDQFLVLAEVANTSGRPVHNMILSVVNNAKLLQVTPSHIRLGTLLPGSKRSFRFHVDAPKVKKMYNAENPAEYNPTTVAVGPDDGNKGTVTLLKDELNIRVILASTSSSSNGEAPLLSALVVMPPIQYEE